VLHNADHLYIGEVDEGELSILQSEITKMTLRIREQNQALKKEKEHLADSLADIAHQLRTPLTSVNLILSLLENNSNEHERKALIRETKELFVQMDWLLTSLLKLSRLDAGIGYQKQFKTSSKTAWKVLGKTENLRLFALTTHCLLKLPFMIVVLALKKKIYTTYLTGFIVEKNQVQQDMESA
jgi:signal transduction histidine kinase